STVREIARIAPDDFYVYNFPGSMEVSALFRPHVKYDDGVVTEFEMPTNIFSVDESANLVFFVGKEPNLRWQTFADNLFALATRLLRDAPKHGIEMLSLVAEIPGYLQGINPLSIETISRRLAKILNQPIDLDALRETSNHWESQVTAAVEKDEELAATIRKLE